MAPLPKIFDPTVELPPTSHNADLSRLPAALAPLVEQRRWIVWRWEPKPAKDGWTKVPYQAHRPSQTASTNRPYTWNDYRVALQAYEAGQAHGIGFMLHDAEFAALDLDDCRDKVTGEIAAWALELVQEAASYAEVTVSGTGLRIIGRATGEHVHRNQNLPGTVAHIESYRRATRYIVVTGSQLSGARDLTNIDGVIDRLVASLDAASAPQPAPPRPRYSVGRRDVLPPDLQDLIRGGIGVGQRSEQFHHVVGWLRDMGWTAGEIENELAAYPDGIASKYKRRLRKEIERCYGKVRDRPYVVQERLGDPVAAENQKALARKTHPAVALASADEDYPVKEPSIPSEGLLGQLIDFGLNAVEAPNDWFAFGVAASIMSTLIGRCWYAKIGPHATHANLYVTILASSSFGKTSYLNAFLGALGAADAQRFIGASSIASAAGLRKMIEMRGNTLCTIDEIGGEFGRILNRRAQAHDAQIKSYLLSLFSASPSLWGGTAYGEGETHTIYNPCLSILGFSTPSDFWRRFSEEQVRDGLLPRFLFIEAKGDPRFVDDPLYEETPPQLIEAIHGLINARAAIQMTGANISAVGWGITKPNLCRVANGEGLDELRKEAKREERQSVVQAERDSEGIKVPFLGRSVEMATKLALIMAVSADPLAPVITTDRFSAAQKIADYLIGSTARRISGDDIFESEFGRQNKQEMDRTITTIQKLSGKGGVTLAGVVRRLRNHQKSRDTIEIINVLQADGLVIVWEDETTKEKMINWRR